MLCRKSIFFGMAIFALLILPLLYLHTAARSSSQKDPIDVLDAYLKASYSRDYQAAYGHISSEDRSLKDERTYVRERGAFTGFTLDVSRKLAESIRIEPVERQITSDQARIKARLRVPNANELSDIVLDWNFDELNSLPAPRQKAILDKIEKLKKEGKLPMVEGEETFQLVKEAAGWRIFLDWGSGVKLTFEAALPSGPQDLIEAEIVQRDVITKPGELFNISLHIKNRGNEEVLARIGHLVQPVEGADYLDLVECGFLLPVRIRPGATEEFSSTYLLRGGLPENVRQLAVTYEFKIEK